MPEQKTWKKSWKTAVRLTQKQETLLLVVRVMEINPDYDLPTLEELESSLNIPGSTIHYNLSKLKGDGLIEWKCRGRYRLTPKGKKFVAMILKDITIAGRKLRAHKIQCVFKIMQAPKNIDAIRNLCRPVSNQRYNAHCYTIDDATIMIYRKTVVVNVEGFHSESIEQNASIVQKQYVMPLIDFLENTFDMKIDKLATKVHIDHFANLGTRLAKIAQNLNFRYVSNILHIDASHGNPEIETVGENSVENMMTLLEIITTMEKKVREEGQNDNSKSDTLE